MTLVYYARSKKKIVLKSLRELTKFYSPKLESVGYLQTIDATVLPI